MAAIAGIIKNNRKNENINSKVIHSMIKAIEHRGNTDNVFQSVDCIDIGMRNLLVSPGEQGGYYDSDDITAMVDGGFMFLSNGKYSHSPGSDIADEFRKKGIKCIEEIDGLYAIVIIDKKEKQVFLIRDRYAYKPLYYYPSGNALYFASEIKSFCCIDSFKRKINYPMIRDYLLYAGMQDHSSYTFFSEVHQIMAGEYIKFDVSSFRFKKARYNNYSKLIKHRKTTVEDAAKHVRRYLFSSIQSEIDYLSDEIEGLGACLSGGLDSTSIVCCANQIIKKKNSEFSLKTFSAYYEVEEADESKYIKEAVGKTSCLNYKISPSFNEFVHDLDDLIYIQDEPFSSTAIYAQYRVYKEAKNQGIKIMLDGQAADEFLSYSEAHQLAYIVELIHHFKLYKLKKTIHTYRTLYGRRINLKHLIMKALQFKMPEWVFKLKNRKLEKNYGLIFDADEPIFGKIGNEVTNFKNSCVTDMVRGWPKEFHHIDRNAMCNTIENRAPFANYKMIQYVLSLNSDVVIQDGVTKFLLRKSMDGIIPDLIRDRYSKLGFATPEHMWFMENKSNIIRQYHTALKDLSMLFDFSIASKVTDESFIFRVICLYHWIKVFSVEIEGEK